MQEAIPRPQFFHRAMHSWALSLHSAWQHSILPDCLIRLAGGRLLFGGEDRAGSHENVGQLRDGFARLCFLLRRSCQSRRQLVLLFDDGFDPFGGLGIHHRYELLIDRLRRSHGQSHPSLGRQLELLWELGQGVGHENPLTVFPSS